MFLAFLSVLGDAFSIGGIISSTESEEQQLRLDSINLKRQEAVAKSQASQKAIEQDKKMSHILSAENVESAVQGTTPAGFSAITMNNIRNFAEDRQNLNTNERLSEDIFKSKEESVKAAKSQLHSAEFLSIGSTLIKGTMKENPLSSVNIGGSKSNAASNELISSIFGE
ncbi:MAG: hypothetical protein ACTSR1_00245 [Candidatus Heimdallarchaeota archaeon]